MARKSTGKTGKHSGARSSVTSIRSKNKQNKSSQGSSSSRRGSEGQKVVSISSGRRESSGRKRPSGASRSAQADALTDHDEIRQWAEERGAHPAFVRGTGDPEDVGMIRLDFPGHGGEGSLEEIGWGEWFDKFDESGLALLVQEQTAGGQKSNFNKLVKRETAGARESGGRSPSKRTA